MPSRASKQFANLTQGKNLASVPKNMREAYMADSRQKLLNNLDNSKYATLNLNTKITIVPHLRSTKTPQELSLYDFIMNFGDKTYNIMGKEDGYSMHFATEDDILNFNDHVLIDPSKGLQETINKDFDGNETEKRKIFDNKKEYLDVMLNRDENGISKMQFINFVERGFKYFQKHAIGQPCVGNILLKKQPLAPNAKKSFMEQYDLIATKNSTQD